MSNYLNDPITAAIVKARVKLLLDKPFFGQMATRLNIIDASTWCKTAATDGRNFYYNREFIKSLTQPEMLFLMGHEVLHNVFDHLSRRGSRDPKVWNMAGDYIINYVLVKESIGKMPASGLYDEKYTDEMTTEEVYEKLIQNQVKIKMPLDEHIDPSTGQVDDGEGNTIEVTLNGTDGPPKLSKDELDQLRNEIRAAAIQAANAVGAGKVPAAIRRMISELTEPQLDWRAMLDTHIRSAYRSDYSFQTPSRRSWGLGAILPGPKYEETIDIAVSIDTSGSMTDEMLRDMLSEVKGIMETFGDFKLRLWTFDTQVYGYKEFTGENLDEIDEYHPQGGGGTLFEANWEFMKEQDMTPQRFIMFTDGYPGNGWGDEEYCDTLFIIHGTTSIVAPYGQTAYYSPKTV